MEEENQEVENSPHGSVTGEGPSGGDNIIGQQLTPPSPPPRPQAVGRVRMTERTPSCFFIPQQPRILNFLQPENELSRYRELSEG